MGNDKNRYRGLQSCEVELRVCNTFDSEIIVFILIFILFFPVVETLILGAVATSSVCILLVQGAWCLCAEGDRELVLGNNESENWAGQTWCQHFFVGFFFSILFLSFNFLLSFLPFFLVHSFFPKFSITTDCVFSLLGRLGAGRRQSSTFPLLIRRCLSQLLSQVWICECWGSLERAGVAVPPPLPRGGQCGQPALPDLQPWDSANPSSGLNLQFRAVISRPAWLQHLSSGSRAAVTFLPSLFLLSVLTLGQVL